MISMESPQPPLQPDAGPAREPEVKRDASAAPVQTANDRRSPVERVFIGPGGIRSGWRLLMFIVMTALCEFILLTLAQPLVSRFRILGFVEGDLATLISALAASLVMGRIEGRSLADYGLPRRGVFGRQFWAGAAWGFCALTCLLEAIHLGHGFEFGGVVLGGRSLAGYAVFWGFTFLVVGFSEEYLFRGYALATLSTGIGFWPSAVLLSALFGGIHIHNGGEDWTGALCAGVIGLFFCFTLRRTGSLWFAVGMHAAWDYAESFVYSVPDSGIMVPGHMMSPRLHGPTWLTGGSVGPEGSAFVFVLIAGLFVTFNLLYRDARFRPEIVAQPAGSRPSGVHSLGAVT